MALCFQSVLLAGTVPDVPPHVAGVGQGMCVIMWMVGVLEHVSRGTMGTSVTRVSDSMYFILIRK